jgi:predicted transposase YbfD/YdcC
MPLMTCLAEIKEPRRVGYAHRYDLREILVIAICATLSDVDNFEDMAFWASQKEGWLKRFLTLKNGIPSHDTLNRVFRLLDPKTFEEAFRRWVAGIVPVVGDNTLAVDGKTVRGSRDGSRSPIHLVSAFATEVGLALGQEKVADKRNEITAIPELLKALLIRGYRVTLDAMGCQREIAATILDQGADYLLAVKGNQPHLLAILEDRFDTTQRERLREVGRCFERVERSHGRLVIQRAWVAPQTGEVDEMRWPGCKMLASVDSLRVAEGKESLERRYYISSRMMSAEAFADAVRAHWGIENRLHWMLDVNFGEDAATVRKDYAADNLSRLRKIVLNVLRVETATAHLGKLSLTKKRKLAAWNDEVRMAMLGISPVYDG